MSGVNVFNNTFYNDRTLEQTWRPLLHIYTNTDKGGYSVAHDTKVYNNIFYTKYRTPVITIADEESLTGFTSDYNVFWCETGTPLFIINNVNLSFEQWQAKGYDTHSVVMNPLFRDLVNFVPDRRIDKGLNLGQDWSEGLSVSAKWGGTDPATVMQSGSWQVGAVIHGEEGGQTGAFEITQSVLTRNSPATIEISFSMDVLSRLPDASSFIVTVNSNQRIVESISLTGNKLILNFPGPVVHTDKITVDYIKPAENPLQSVSGDQLLSFSKHLVINNISSGRPRIHIYPNPAKHYFNISNTGSDQLPQIIKIFSLSGVLFYEKRLDDEFLYKVQISLPPGIYILYLKFGSQAEQSQKLIVVE
jgi:hypothetical protein